MLKGNCRKKNLTTYERKISSYKPALKDYCVRIIHVKIHQDGKICLPTRSGSYGQFVTTKLEFMPTKR